MPKQIFDLRHSSISNMLSNLTPLLDDEEDVSYDVESLFTNIKEQIYMHKKLNLIHSKLIFRYLLLKFAT